VHKYAYEINGVYILTDEIRPNLEPVTLPFNMYKDPVKVATAYIRWSDEGQSDGHSLYIQEREIVARAKLEGIKVIVMFIDKAKSAYHIPAQKREKMLEMKQYILSNPNVEATIFYDESRITRLIEDFVLYILGPIKTVRPNLKVYSTKIDGEWDENNVHVQARLAYAHEESVEKSRRAYDYHKTEIIDSPNPQRPASRHPYGYSKSTKKDGLIEVNEYAAIVKLIFYLYSFGYSDKKIAQLLNQSDIPVPSAEGISWSDATIRYILKNHWYAGDLAWFVRTSYEKSKRKPIDEITLIPNHHEALIGPNLWNITQFFRSYKENKDRMDSPFILRDLIFCSTCNVKLKAKNMTPSKSKKKYLYYLCPNCQRKVNIDDLHSWVLGDFSYRWSRELKHYQNKINKILRKWKKVLSSKIATTTEQIVSLRYNLSMLEEGQDYYNDLKEIHELQLSSLEKEKLELQKVSEKIDMLLNDELQFELIDRLKQDIHDYSFEEKRSIILLAIKKIEIDFSRDNHTSIEYRLTPYIDIETLMESIDKSETA
jgi:site-specific DNA recombinase